MLNLTLWFWIQFVATVSRAFFNKEEKEKASEEASELLQILERELKHKYFGGENIGLVDIVGSFIAYWVPVIEQVMEVKIFVQEKCPKLWQWRHDFVSHPVIKEILPQKDKLIAALKARLESTN